MYSCSSHGTGRFSPPTARAGLAFALRTVWSEPGTSAYFASSWFRCDAHLEAVPGARNRWGTPPLNLVYADIHGNIGWAAAAAVPVRPNWDGLLPVPGDGRYEWQGLLGGRLAAVGIQPCQGLVCDRQRDEPPRRLSGGERKIICFEWGNRSRIDRIDAVLGGKPKLSIADSMALQTDSHDALSRSLIAMLQPITSPDPLVAKSIEDLKAWDGDETTDSIAATVYEVWTSRYLVP